MFDPSRHARALADFQSGACLYCGDGVDGYCRGYWLCEPCYETPSFYRCLNCKAPFQSHLGAPTFKCLYEVTSYVNSMRWINAIKDLVSEGLLPMRPLEEPNAD